MSNRISSGKKGKTIYATRRTVLSFFLVILIGSLLLRMPFASKEPTSFINHLFVSTSAVCVTGLVPYAPSVQYTLQGQLIIIALIQIGGLGFLTFYSVMISIFSNRLSYSNRMVMSEALNQSSLKSINQYIRRVVKYTFFFELVGAVLLAFQFVPEFGLTQGLYYSVFHSISAFCNAGFDVLGSNSLMQYDTNLLVNAVVSGLIIAGGLGFVVWIDLRHALEEYRKNYQLFEVKRFLQSLQLHTKIVVIMTVLLLVIGTALTFAVEYNKVLAPYGIMDKLLVSFFTSTTLRTAGFATIDFASLTRFSKLWMCGMMIIGGSPAGTAGGIKTVTFAISVLYIHKLFVGREHVSLFKRRISKDTVEKALSILVVSIFIVIIALLILSLSERRSLVDLLFEIFSAYGTVGLTCSITPSLSVVGKLVIIVLMFMGRVGPLSIIMIQTQSNHKEGNEVTYPIENVIIG